ncbi:MAG: transcription termination/antitermination protein NusA [Candidatus Colwellbacteria bacterium]|nr:transcription termination/antitermination protein NusA [Candidatus Colwellbacteria bacterium]
MLDLKNIIPAINQIAEEKGINSEDVLHAIEDSLAAAYKKEYLGRGVFVRAKLDTSSGIVKFYQVKEVVAKDGVRMPVEGEEEIPAVETESEEGKLPRYNPERHTFPEEAEELIKEHKLKVKPEVGSELELPLPQKTDFGRIAAQTAKQVITQKLREVERNSIIQEFKDKEGSVVSGAVQRFERGAVFIDLGRTTGIMPYSETIPGEHYKIGERLRFYVMSVATDLKVPSIVLSRAHPKFVSKLFEIEVPEITDKVVEIKSITREPGSRAKIAVYSSNESIDPVGSCVGQRGTRVMAVTNELGAEKLDIVEWSEDPAKFIANALSPAKAQSVEIKGPRDVLVLVPDNELSLAIGKGGQNVRLAAKLTGWRIDVRSQSRPEEQAEGGIAGTANKEAKSIEETDKPVYLKKREDEDE